MIDSQEAVKGVAALEDLSAATMGRSAYPVENATTCWWTPTGWCSLGAQVHDAASLHDRDGGQRLLNDELAEKLPRLAVVWADVRPTGVGSEVGCAT